jgi:hypothetical protein
MSIHSSLPSGARASTLRVRAALAVAVFGGLSLVQGCDGGTVDLGAQAAATAAAVARWNAASIDASGLDHMPSNQGPIHTFGQQVGPCRAARAIAIVHIAMFEALNSIDRRYQSFAGVPAYTKVANMPAAVAQAARDSLASMFPSQAYIFDGFLAADLAAIPNSPAKFNGIEAGLNACATVLAMRAADGANHPEPLYGVDYFPLNDPGKWRQDPVTLHPLALGALWMSVDPFVMTSASQFRCPPFPALDSPEYATAYNEVKSFGGDGVNTPTVRTADQTEAGIYWAYDGTPSLCAPPRLYNQIATQIAAQQGSDYAETCRLLALVNVSLADAGVASWDSKYFYDIWRPVTGIREADAGTGPSGLGDGNAATTGDSTFLPLGAPASNATSPNFTPPFPAYPSGHATFGGALFQILRRVYGTDDIPFTFVSDEYNGVTVDNQGNVRPLIPRSFTNLSQAEEENGQSRIYLGIHWSFDKTAGIAEGNQVANWVFDHAFLPLNAAP